MDKNTVPDKTKRSGSGILVKDTVPDPDMTKTTGFGFATLVKAAPLFKNELFNYIMISCNQINITGNTDYRNKEHNSI